MQETPTKTRIDRGTWIVLVCGAAVAAVYVALVFLPQERMIRKLTGELSAKQSYLDRAGNLGAMILATQQELDQANAHNSKWHEYAPNGNEPATLFGEISALAKAAGTTATRFDPEPIVAYGKIREIPLMVGFRGQFAQVHKFLVDLESLPEAIWVKHLGLETVPQNDKDVQAKISLVIFTDNPDNSDQVDRSG